MALVTETVLVVDDHAAFRHAVRLTLEADGWSVIGEAADGAEAFRLAAELGPDVVLLDVGLPDVSGLEIARDLGDAADGAAIVLVSTHDSADFRELAIASGARGFLAKAELSGAAVRELLA